MRQPVLEALPGEPLRAGRTGPLADADSDDARGEQQHVAALQVLQPWLVQQRGPGETRVMAVDRVRERGFTLAGPHREAGDGDAVADPDG